MATPEVRGLVMLGAPPWHSRINKESNCIVSFRAKLISQQKARQCHDCWILWQQKQIGFVEQLKTQHSFMFCLQCWMAGNCALRKDRYSGLFFLFACLLRLQFSIEMEVLLCSRKRFHYKWWGKDTKVLKKGSKSNSG